jgi:hypothetical protein
MKSALPLLIRVSASKAVLVIRVWESRSNLSYGHIGGADFCGAQEGDVLSPFSRDFLRVVYFFSFLGNDPLFIVFQS